MDNSHLALSFLSKLKNSIGDHFLDQVSLLNQILEKKQGSSNLFPQSFLNPCKKELIGNKK